MSVLREIKKQIVNIGYSSIERDYAFSDVFESCSVDRQVSLAAFTQAPPSYRSAAIAVVQGEQNNEETVNQYRALGAPLLFVVNGDRVNVWEIRATDVACRTTISAQEMTLLFEKNSDDWGPESIRRAKSIGQYSRAAQRDFVDIGLLPAIEGQVHTKLDALLNEALVEAVGARNGRPRHQIDQRFLFRTVFRLLAAKVLQDRMHELAESWDQNDIASVLAGISAYYTLEELPGEKTSLQNSMFSSTWEHLRHGINFRNISSDDLAFVYENTLISQETRKNFGTHGTPRAVAEYVVGQLGLWDENPEDLRIYEPFCGAGIFLVAALKSLRDRLPIGWTDAQRHKFLVERIRGDEFDPFAREVATLSLILADYPNANGWQISEVDLFKEDNLEQRLAGSSIVLCNAPFEDFSLDERRRYPHAAASSVSKPIVALNSTLDVAPTALGFVLPEPFLKGNKYKEQRKRVEKLYRQIELVALPDRIFKHSVIRSSLLIARDKRPGNSKSVGKLSSTVVSVQKRDEFLRCGEGASTRVKAPHIVDGRGALWVDELDEVWRHLDQNPKLEQIAKASRGIEWRESQSSAHSHSPVKGFVPGVAAARSVRAFALENIEYLDTRPERLRGNAIKQAWSKDKLIANASRLSRGPWCFAASIDRSGLIASQQLYGIWPVGGASLAELSAILNSPVAVGFLASQSPPDRIRLSTLMSVPVPFSLSGELEELVKKYGRLVEGEGDLFSQKRMEQADHLLSQIDALVLRSYDLPPRAERQLLEYFRGDTRPTRHHWEHWYPEDFHPFVPLHEFLADEFEIATEPVRRQNKWGI